MKVLKYNGVGYNAKWVARQDMDGWVQSRIDAGEHKKLPMEERRTILAGVWKKCCIMCGINPNPKPVVKEAAEPLAKGTARKKTTTTKRGAK